MSPSGGDCHTRAVLIEWLWEVSRDFRFAHTTFLLAVRNLDRFLATTPVPVPVAEWQVVGLAALRLTAKYEDIVVPTAYRAVSFTAGAHTCAELCQAEWRIAAHLRFSMAGVTAQHYLWEALSVGSAVVDVDVLEIAEYLICMATLSIEFLVYSPPELAAGAYVLAIWAGTAEPPDPAVATAVACGVAAHLLTWYHSPIGLDTYPGIGRSDNFLVWPLAWPRSNQ